MATYSYSVLTDFAGILPHLTSLTTSISTHITGPNLTSIGFLGDSLQITFDISLNSLQITTLNNICTPGIYEPNLSLAYNSTDVLITLIPQGTVSLSTLFTGPTGPTGTIGPAGTGQMAMLQVRQTATTTILGSATTFTSCVFNTLDIANNTSIINNSTWSGGSGSTGTTIQITQAGYYNIGYYGTVDISNSSSIYNFRILLNGTTLVPGSYQSYKDSSINAFAITVLANIPANSYVEFQYQSNNSGNANAIIQPGNIFWAQLMTSQIGPTGPTGPIASCTEISSLVTTSTTSTTYVLVNSLSTKPTAGNYFVTFNASGTVSTTTATGSYAIYVGGVLQTSSERFFLPNNATARNTLLTQCKITANGSAFVEVYYKTSAGTFSLYQRNLMLEQVL